MKLFPVSIMTADQMVYQERVYSLTVPAGLGYLGILADHVPLISSLTAGKIAIKRTPQEMPRVLDVQDGGFLEISRNGVTVFLPSASS